MSNSLLYHAFGLKDVKYKGIRYQSQEIIVKAEMSRYIRCPGCGDRYPIFKGQKTRRLRMSPLGRKSCSVDLTLHRLQCRQCGQLWWPQLPFMLGKHRYVRSFALTVLDLLRFGTIRAVAHYLKVGWDLVKEIHKSKLRKLYRRIPLQKVRYLGIDEFSLRKGHVYMTVFLDLERGRIVHAVEGKSKDAIAPFLRKLAKKGTHLKAIAMDMSSSYMWAVREYLPHVDIVFDRFHVMALMNTALDELRRELQRELDVVGQKTLKGSRFLLLRNYDRLQPDRKARLDALLAVNQPLYEMHTMKEQLREFWDKVTYTQGRVFLETWCKDALESDLTALQKVAKTLAGYRTGLLNFFKHRITNAVTEGTNNKIKTLKRQAYGFRDMEYFKLRLYHLHTQRYSLTG
jgi:transposase